uniref:Uncharacterized protein n=1 Tax=Romanomermis culicivorax TaxID=13658 RepID=A0A915KHT0_ROMCU
MKKKIHGFSDNTRPVSTISLESPFLTTDLFNLGIAAVASSSVEIAPDSDDDEGELGFRTSGDVIGETTGICSARGGGGGGIESKSISTPG